LIGRSGIGWEASTVDPNVTAANAFLADSVPPSNEDYIEFTAPAYQDDSGNDIPVLRFETGNNSNNAAEAIQKDKYFQVRATAKAGVLLNLSSLTFNAGKGGTGGLPSPRGYAVLSSVDGYTNILDSQDLQTVRPAFTPVTIDLSGASFQGLTAVTFRIYTYVPGPGRSVEYSNVTINGTVQ